MMRFHRRAECSNALNSKSKGRHRVEIIDEMIGEKMTEVIKERTKEKSKERKSRRLQHLHPMIVEDVEPSDWGL